MAEEPSNRLPARLPWLRRCDSCHKVRNVELFAGEELTCQLCRRRAEREAAGKLHKSERQIEAARKQTLSAEQRYRLQLQRAGYSGEQIERYVRRRFHNQAPELSPWMA